MKYPREAVPSLSHVCVCVLLPVSLAWFFLCRRHLLMDVSADRNKAIYDMLSFDYYFVLDLSRPSTLWTAFSQRHTHVLILKGQKQNTIASLQMLSPRLLTCLVSFGGFGDACGKHCSFYHDVCNRNALVLLFQNWPSSMIVYDLLCIGLAEFTRTLSSYLNSTSDSRPHSTVF